MSLQINSSYFEPKQVDVIADITWPIFVQLIDYLLRVCRLILHSYQPTEGYLLFPHGSQLEHIHERPAELNIDIHSVASAHIVLVWSLEQ